MTQDQQAELLPCPFCGGVAELVETMGSQASAFSPYFRVTCAECGVHQDQWDERKPAIAAWNTRATPKSSEGELLEEAIEVLEWYGEQARLARLVHSEGDAGRHALANDGGNRAIALLAKAGKARP